MVLEGEENPQLPADETECGSGRNYGAATGSGCEGLRLEEEIFLKGIGLARGSGQDLSAKGVEMADNKIRCVGLGKGERLMNQLRTLLAVWEILSLRPQEKEEETDLGRLTLG